MRGPEARPPQATEKRQRAERRGHFAEYLAAAWLIAKGYRVLAMRYRTKRGEIDLIVRKGDLIAFVEVKARKHEGAALDAVSYGAQHRIRAASEVWLSRRRDGGRLSYRYDVVAVLPGRLPRHFPDAF